MRTSDLSRLWHRFEVTLIKFFCQVLLRDMAAIFRRAISVFRHNPPGKHKGPSPTLCKGASLSISRTVCLPAQEHVLSNEQTLVACVSKKEDMQAWRPIFGGLALATAAAFGHPTLMSVYKPSTLVPTLSHINTHARIAHAHHMHIP